MKKGFLAAACSLGALLFAVPTTQAEVFNVGDFTAFQAALTTAAGNGEDDTVNVAGATYGVGTTLMYAPGGGETFDLTINGAGAASTILNGGGSVQVLNLQGNGNVSLSGVTITNGSETGQGGGLLGQALSGTFSISDTTISNSTATGFGGGAQIGGMHISITNSTISGNTAGGNGGGLELFCSDTASTLALTNSTISGNTADGTGGGIDLAGCPTATIDGTTISDNSNTPGNFGTGLFVDINTATTLTINNTTISGNSTGGPCGVGADSGVGAALFARGPVNITRSRFDNNTTLCPGDGAGILLVHGSPSTDTVTIADSFFTRNTSGPGTTFPPVLLITDNGTLNVVNSTFSGNNSGEAAIPDIRLTAWNDPAGLNASNLIIRGGPGYDELHIENDGDSNATPSPAALLNSLFDPAKTTIEAGVTVLDNFNDDPLFKDAANGDFHITENSPAIDKGFDTAPGIQTVDFDGDLRIDGLAVDAGADEFRLPPAFDFPSDTLVIDEVHLSSGTNLLAESGKVKAYSVELTRLDQAGFVFQLDLASVKKTTASSNPGGIFNVKTGFLDIPVVDVGKARTYNVQMQKRPGGFIFDLLKARKNF